MSEQRKEIEQRVFKVVKEVLSLEEQETLTLETTLLTDLGADSVDIVSLLMDLEDEFGGKIEENDAVKLQTLGDIVDYIEHRAASEENL